MASAWLLQVSRAISFGIEELTEALETTYNSVQTTASGLESNGWLTRLKPGLYLLVPLLTGEESQYTAHKFYIANHLVDPIYIDFWSALGFHGFTEQVPPSIYVATTKRLSDRPSTTSCITSSRWPNGSSSGTSSTRSAVTRSQLPAREDAR